VSETIGRLADDASQWDWFGRTVALSAGRWCLEEIQEQLWTELARRYLDIDIDIVVSDLPLGSGAETLGTTLVLGGIVESWRELKVVMDGGVLSLGTFLLNGNGCRGPCYPAKVKLGIVLEAIAKNNTKARPEKVYDNVQTNRMGCR
jgi:hypothetical protein